MTVLPEHLVTLLDESRQIAFPAVPGVVSPLRTRSESLSVLIVTPLVPLGVKVLCPWASNV